MEVHRSAQFVRWVDGLVARANAGDPKALKTAQHVYDELTYLKSLEAEPTEGTGSIIPVRHSKGHQVWRLSHPFDADIAVRIICWFDTGNSRVVVALFGVDKSAMGDVFYDSVGSRADAEIIQWKRENEGMQ